MAAAGFITREALLGIGLAVPVAAKHDENAIAIAGGFTPRAYKWDIRIDRPIPGGVARKSVPPLTRVRPGDTIVITERWF